MPKLERWIVAEKKVRALDDETREKILDVGGQMGGGWDHVHQHIMVNPDNKEIIEKLLLEKGYEITSAESISHPENRPGGRF